MALLLLDIGGPNHRIDTIRKVVRMAGEAELGLAAAQMGQSERNSLFNMGMSIANYNYMKDMQNRVFEREDNAVQRRAADLEAAGLSKTLAAGGAAQTMAPIRVEAPQMHSESGPADMMKNSLGMQQMKQALVQQQADISKTNAQTEYEKVKKQKMEQAIDYLTNMNPLKQREQEIKNIVADESMRDRINYYAYKANSEEVRRANIQADTDLERSGITANVFKNILNGALSALASTRVGNEFQEGIRDRAYFENWDKNKRENENKRLGLETAIKQFIVNKIGKEGRQWTDKFKEDVLDPANQDIIGPLLKFFGMEN